MIEDFFHLPRVPTTPGCTLSCEYLSEFLKKFETALMVYAGAWGKLIHEKTRSRKYCDTVPLRGSSHHPDWRHFNNISAIAHEPIAMGGGDLLLTLGDYTNCMPSWHGAP
jgi:hypothetical protein